MLGVIICDESGEFKKLAVNQLKDLIAFENLEAEIALVTGNRDEITAKLEVGRIFLILLDLVYNGRPEGPETALQIRTIDRESYIVFSTEHTELMHLIFKGMIRPAGFMKKPVSKDDLSSVFLDAYRDYVNNTEIRDTYTVNIGTKLYKIPYKRIIYFEAREKKIFLCTENQRISFYSTLETIGEQLADKGFLRCHKGFIINRDRIESIDFSDMLVHMSNGVEIPLSRTYKQLMKDELAG